MLFCLVVFFVELEEVVEADLEMEEYLWIYYRIFFFSLLCLFCSSVAGMNTMVGAVVLVGTAHHLRQ